MQHVRSQRVYNCNNAQRFTEVSSDVLWLRACFFGAEGQTPHQKKQKQKTQEAQKTRSEPCGTEHQFEMHSKASQDYVIFKLLRLTQKIRQEFR
jgi:hypothetical protein